MLSFPHEGLRIVEAMFREERDARALHRLAQACHRVSPVVIEDPPHGLIIDLVGCDRLFARSGGASGTIDRVEAMLRAWGIRSRIAMAATATMARAWARHGTDMVGAASFRAARVVDSESHARLRDSLPVESLEISTEAAAALAAVRIRTIGDLRAIPRSTIPVRYGVGTLRRLDEMDGRRTEVMNPVVFEEETAVAETFAGPVRDGRVIERRLADLIRRIASELRRRGRLAMDVELRARRPDRADWFDMVRCAQGTRRGGHLWCLLRPIASRIPLDDGIDGIRLRVLKDRRDVDRVGSFWRGLSPLEDEDPSCGRLLDRIVARFGDDAVVRFQPRPGHIPEDQCRLASESRSGCDRDPVGEASVECLARLGRDPRQRPTLMLDPAERIGVTMCDHRPCEISWRSERCLVHAAHGPESIGIPWWRDRKIRFHADARREYWRVVMESGPWLWVFRRSSDDRWFVQGIWA